MRKQHDWPALVEAHARSGLTQKAFCEHRGIHPVNFSLNRRKLLGKGTSASEASSDSRFLRARPAPRTDSGYLELSLGIMTLRFNQATPPAYVAELVAALS